MYLITKLIIVGVVLGVSMGLPDPDKRAATTDVEGPQVLPHPLPLIQPKGESDLEGASTFLWPFWGRGYYGGGGFYGGGIYGGGIGYYGGGYPYYGGYRPWSYGYY